MPDLDELYLRLFRPNGHNWEAFNSWREPRTGLYVANYKCKDCAQQWNTDILKEIFTCEVAQVMNV